MLPQPRKICFGTEKGQFNMFCGNGNNGCFWIIILIILLWGCGGNCGCGNSCGCGNNCCDNNCGCNNGCC